MTRNKLHTGAFSVHAKPLFADYIGYLLIALIEQLGRDDCLVIQRFK